MSKSCVHKQFEFMVNKNPNNVAIVACDRSLTYQELNSEANRIANVLIELGIKHGDIVALKLERNSFLFSAILGTLKAGAAYLPVDPALPKSRIEYMLADSNAKFNIDNNNIYNLSKYQKDTNPELEISLDSVCYCVYTSGSTGQPKGVEITHRNVINFCNYGLGSVNISCINRILCTTTIGFDIFVTESIFPLLNGLTIILADESQSKVQRELNRLVLDTGAELLQTTPSKMKLLIANPKERSFLSKLKVIILGGEVLEETLVDKLAQNTDAEIFNIYGPTEATVWCTLSNVTGKRMNRNKRILDIQPVRLDFLMRGEDNENMIPNKTFNKLFEAKVNLIPNNIAVVADDRSLTYKELDLEANRIANALLELGVKTGAIVAFNLPRDSHLIPAILGILKTGAAYLPIDPTLPESRVEYMLNDSNAKAFIDTEMLNQLLDCKNCENPNIYISPDSICYCIYTSGSTGTPKGVLITHRNVVNYCDKGKGTLFDIANLDNYQRIISTTTVGFDIFVTESLLPLLNGMTVVLADESQAKIQSELNKLIVDKDVEILQTTPSKMKVLISNSEEREYLSRLKVIILGGEVLEESLVDELFLYTDAEIFNIYGPTEATVWCTVARIMNNNTELKIKKVETVANKELFTLYQFNNTSGE